MKGGTGGAYFKMWELRTVRTPRMVEMEGEGRDERDRADEEQCCYATRGRDN